MAKLKLSQAIEVPGSSQAEFDIPDVATLGLFRGVKLPLSVDANSMKVDINLEAGAVTQLISNLLQIPPSFVEKMPLPLVGEVVKAALPLLPPGWQSFTQSLKTTSAT